LHMEMCRKKPHLASFNAKRRPILEIEKEVTFSFLHNAHGEMESGVTCTYFLLLFNLKMLQMRLISI